MGALLGGWDPQRVGCCPFRAVSLLCEGCFVCERKQNHFLSKKAWILLGVGPAEMLVSMKRKKQGMFLSPLAETLPARVYEGCAQQDRPMPSPWRKPFCSAVSCLPSGQGSG